MILTLIAAAGVALLGLSGSIRIDDAKERFGKVAAYYKVEEMKHVEELDAALRAFLDYFQQRTTQSSDQVKMLSAAN